MELPSTRERMTTGFQSSIKKSAENSNPFHEIWNQFWGSFLNALGTLLDTFQGSKWSSRLDGSAVFTFGQVPKITPFWRSFGIHFLTKSVNSAGQGPLQGGKGRVLGFLPLPSWLKDLPCSSRMPTYSALDATRQTYFAA